MKIYPDKVISLVEKWPTIKDKIIHLLRSDNKKIKDLNDLALLHNLDIMRDGTWACIYFFSTFVAIYQINFFTLIDSQAAAILHLLPLVIGFSYVNIPVDQRTVKNGPKTKRVMTKRRASLQETREGLFILSPVSCVMFYRQ